MQKWREDLEDISEVEENESIVTDSPRRDIDLNMNLDLYRAELK